jgi:hypothetical protein
VGEGYQGRQNQSERLRAPRAFASHGRVSVMMFQRLLYKKRRALTTQTPPEDRRDRPDAVFLFYVVMSALGGKADMTLRENPLSWSLLEVKWTCLVALHMSAFDPKRTY